MIKTVLLRGNKVYYWSGGDLHTDQGIIKEAQLKKKPSKVRSNKGKYFTIFDANFIDQLTQIRRGPAIMINKDIGMILANTGIDKNSKVLDAGSGCGILTIFLARFVKKVYSYEIRDDFFKVAKRNIALFKLNNITIKNKDVYKKIDEKNLDLITFDLPEPWKALDNAYNALKSGAFLVCFLPTIVQVQKLIEKTEEKFIHVKTVELLEREWHVEGNKVRPKSEMIAHTGFLVFLRKI